MKLPNLRLKLFVLLLLIINIANTIFAQEVQPQQRRRVVRILSIDGGGVRGIIPAAILNHIEERLPEGTRIAEYFDIIAGTSVGGILSLMLTVPDENIPNKPKYSTNEILQKIEVFSKRVFGSENKSWWQGWYGSKYKADGLKNSLKENFGNSLLLSQATNFVLIPTFAFEHEITFFFNSKKAQTLDFHNCFVKDLAYATSAAPTYFPAARLTDKHGRTTSLIDGGVAVNNPSLSAVAAAIKKYGRDIDLFIVSIGTGATIGMNKTLIKDSLNKDCPKLNNATKNGYIKYKNVADAGKVKWMKKNIVDLLMYAPMQIVDYTLGYLLHNSSTTHKYHRLQVYLQKGEDSMDDASDSNIKNLRQKAQEYIDAQNKQLTEIINALKIYGRIKTKQALLRS